MEKKIFSWLALTLVWLFILTLFAAWFKRYEYVKVMAPPGAFYRVNRFTGNVEFVLLTNQGPVAMKTGKIEQVKIPRNEKAPNK
jgi:hypothetical protein